MASDIVDYTLIPISCGRVDVDWDNLTLKRHKGEKLRVPCVIWVVRGGDRVFIVDSGPGDPATVKRVTGRDLDQDEPPEEALRRLSIDPEAVKTLVLSHLHWDHAGGLHLFPNAEIFVHRQEMHFAVAPPPIQMRPYEWEVPNGHLPRWLSHRRRMRVIDRDIDIAPGLRIVHLPGHTPGCIGLCCSTRSGRHLIACDAAPTYENLRDGVPPGWYSNLEEAYATLDKMREIADVVLPGHESGVFEVKSYPRVGSQS